MIEQQSYGSIPTNLDLNGPILSFIKSPSPVTINVGLSASFTGVATAIFPSQTPNNPASNTGIITYRWYDQDGPLFDDPPPSGGDGVTISGAGTTVLNLYNNTRSRSLFLRADYIPSAYGLPNVEITAGTARSTGNAINEPKDTNVVSLNVIPNLLITSEPFDSTVAVGNNATFVTSASLTDGTTNSIQYQWIVNDVDAIDGTFNSDGSSLGTNGILTIKDELTGISTTVDFNQLSTYSNFITGRVYTLTSNSNITSTLTASGAGGGSSIERSALGGYGGLSTATFTFTKGNTYKLVVGGSGVNGGVGGYGGGGNGGGGTGKGGGGGGYTGLFLNSVTQSNSIIIAGGGGGGANDPANGGNGGGLIAGNGGNAPSRGGTGGTQSSGGTGNQNGTALQGGAGSAGGGGGYFGGGGGIPYGECCADGAGGGGSGYIHPTLLSNATTTTGQGAQPGSNGTFAISIQSNISTAKITASGTKTPTLRISSDLAGLNDIKCRVSNATAANSPLFTRTSNFTVLVPRSILNIEKYQRSSSIARLESVDLSQVSSYTVVRADLSTMFAFYAAERDLTLEVELFGPSGANYGSFLGGEGGYSKIRFTAKKNEEYTVAGLDAGLPPFLYRKAALIACVGEGGDAYYAGNGGAGGGISVSGGNGSGSNAGAGGQVISVGSLTLNGIYGSLTTATDIRTGDSKASVPNGGRTIACTRGNYWNNVGYAPCDDLGNIQFRMESGLLVTNSAVISRGHKFGYSIRNTAGAGSNGGNGGDGATGGNGGYNGAGGGGGSGYTDGSVTVLSSRLGGNIGVGKVIIRVVA